MSMRYIMAAGVAALAMGASGVTTPRGLVLRRKAPPTASIAAVDGDAYGTVHVWHGSPVFRYQVENTSATPQVARVTLKKPVYHSRWFSLVSTVSVGAANGFAFAFAGALAVSLVRPLIGNGQDTKWIAFTILFYNSALLLVLRAFWRVAAKRWTDLSPVLVLALFCPALGFLQSLPDLLGVEAAAVPFCYRGLTDGVIFDHHLQWSFVAFAVALVLNVPALVRTAKCR